MRLFISSSLAVLMLGLGVQQAAAVELTAAVGRTEKSTTTWRLGLQKDFQSRWFQSDVGALTGYWDAGYTYWEGDKAANNHSVSLSPVFVYEFNGVGVKPYIELGVGVAAFKNTRVENRRLSTSFQFEDRLGVGLRFQRQAVGVRVIHYSNGGLKKPNDGIDAYSLHYRVRL